MVAVGFAATPGANVMLITPFVELDKDAVSPENLYFA